MNSHREKDTFKIKNNKPIISYGIILYTYDKTSKQLKYLLLRRKNTFGFIDFVRGNYIRENIFHLQNIINEMTENERQIIASKPFHELWRNLWDNETKNVNGFELSNEYNLSKNKFRILKSSGILKRILSQCMTTWTEPEWEFPKGRINHNENYIQCAVREFMEETGFCKECFKVIENILPFEETFIGTDYKSYTYKYYLSYLNCDFQTTSLDMYQKSEVSKLQWVSFEECIAKIRPHNLEKKKLIQNINNVLNKYSLYY